MVILGNFYSWTAVEMRPVDAFLNIFEKEILVIQKIIRRWKLKVILGDLVTTAFIGEAFSNGDTTT